MKKLLVVFCLVALVAVACGDGPVSKNGDVTTTSSGSVDASRSSSTVLAVEPIAVASVYVDALSAYFSNDFSDEDSQCAASGFVGAVSFDKLSLFEPSDVASDDFDFGSLALSDVEAHAASDAYTSCIDFSEYLEYSLLSESSSDEARGCFVEFLSDEIVSEFWYQTFLGDDSAAEFELNPFMSCVAFALDSVPVEAPVESSRSYDVISLSDLGSSEAAVAVAVAPSLGKNLPLSESEVLCAAANVVDRVGVSNLLAIGVSAEDVSADVKVDLPPDQLEHVFVSVVGCGADSLRADFIDSLGSPDEPVSPSQSECLYKGLTNDVLVDVFFSSSEGDVVQIEEDLQNLMLPCLLLD